MEIQRNIKLSQYTTFKIGGAAEYFCAVKNTEDLLEAAAWAKGKGIALHILGGGSNLLISDNGVKGLVIKIELEDISISNEKTVVQAGCSLAKAVTFAYQNSFTGLEWAVGIPGTFGGAVVGNVGAYGGSMSDSVLNVEFLDLSGEEAEIKKLKKEECRFLYRKSLFKGSEKYIVLSAEILMKKKDREEIKEKMDLYLSKRREKVPIENSAGCIFKNIEIDKKGAESVIARRVFLTRQSQPLEIPKEFLKYNKIPAAFLIEQCGLKGAVCGGAEISGKHANFIINRGDAKCEDVIELIELVEKKVQEKFGIKLEREVQAWYNWQVPQN